MSKNTILLIFEDGAVQRALMPEGMENADIFVLDYDLYPEIDEKIVLNIPQDSGRLVEAYSYALPTYTINDDGKKVLKLIKEHDAKQHQ